MRKQALEIEDYSSTLWVARLVDGTGYITNFNYHDWFKQGWWLDGSLQDRLRVINQFRRNFITQNINSADIYYQGNDHASNDHIARVMNYFEVELLECVLEVTCSDQEEKAYEELLIRDNSDEGE